VPFGLRVRHGKGVLVDANLLVLHTVGSLDPKLIGRHKRTSGFTAEDFELLDRFLRLFPRIFVTPNVLTEVSNLLDSGDLRERLQVSLAAVIQVLDERYVPSSDACSVDGFRRLGLTDATLLALAGGGLLVLTADVPLYVELQRKGMEVVNFHHLRERAWEV
jgi:rRNA-processing protein FCF1